MGEVVELKQREPERVIWVCNCGGTVHHHHADGSVECGACGTFASSLDGEWRERLPATPEEPAPLDATNFKVVEFSSAEMFLRRQIKGAGEIVIAIVVNEDGSLSTWSGVLDTPERLDWMTRKLTEADALLRKLRD